MREPYSILIVSGGNTCTLSLKKLLPHELFSPLYTSINAGEAKRFLSNKDVDIVFINSPLSDEFGYELAIDTAKRTSSGIIISVKTDKYISVRDYVEKNGVYTLEKPLSQKSLFLALHFAGATHQRISQYENKNNNLVQKMNDIKLVNHAKLLLISYLSMSEEDAHRFIEKQAMNMRTSKSEIAENIIRTYET